MRARRSALIALVTSLTVAACTPEEPATRGAAAAPALSATTPTTMQTSTPASPCEVDDGTAADLERLLTDDLPPGYEPAPDAAEGTGPTGLDAAASFVGDPQEQLTLSGLGFRRGYQRLWYGPVGGDDLLVHLYELCDSEGATAYLRYTRERLLSPLWGSVEIDVAELPEAGVALLQEVDPSGELFVAILQADGPFYVEIGAYSEGPDDDLDTLTARARDLSMDQVAELP